MQQAPSCLRPHLPNVALGLLAQLLLPLLSMPLDWYAGPGDDFSDERATESKYDGGFEARVKRLELRRVKSSFGLYADGPGECNDKFSFFACSCAGRASDSIQSACAGPVCTMPCFSCPAVLLCTSEMKTKADRLREGDNSFPLFPKTAFGASAPGSTLRPSGNALTS